MAQPPPPDQRYRARGVSAAKEDVHAAIATQAPGLFPGAFCKVIPDLLTGDEDHCLVMHADTAGTKTALAYLAWREGAGSEVWQGVAQDALVMNLDDCACIGATGPFLVCNTIGRNAKRIPVQVVASVIAGYQRLCDLLAREGIDCTMTGGETADVGDIVRTIDVGCTVTTRLRRDAVIDCARMAAGDVIVGFASTGQARWEERENAGIGSNGLTSARHEVLAKGYAEDYPETWAPEIDRALVYCGQHFLHDSLAGFPGTVGEALLSPTRTYLPLIASLLDTIPRKDIHGLIHCSGGGQTKILKFGSGNRYVKDNLPPPPPLFAFIHDRCNLSWAEMYAVYNMGIRLEAVVPDTQVDACLAAGRACGIEARVTGRVEASSSGCNEVVIDSPEGRLQYGG